MHTYIIKYICDIDIYKTVPTPSVTVSAPEDQTVGKSLILRCAITTVRGITSSVNTVWSSNGSELKRTTGITVSSTTSNSMLYKSSYTIGQLRTTDESRSYRCKAVIATSSPVSATNSVTLNVTGKYTYIDIAKN